MGRLNTYFTSSMLTHRIQGLMNDTSIRLIEQVQSLWSGYGQIVRIQSQRSGKSFIAKVIAPKDAGDHPRGWNTKASHQRKLTSYHVETQFYQHYAARTDIHCKVPQLLNSETSETSSLLIMEDLDALGYSTRLERADISQIKTAIAWLAHFHGKFMGSVGAGLWKTGCYWHLETRQDEWQAMPERALKQHAQCIDNILGNANFQTLVHGDAKLANLCFHHQTSHVAAVDFQYVGRGPGVKDLAYLMGSALDDEALHKYGDALLEEYITQLKRAIELYQLSLDFVALEQEIRALYPIAWADFYRFLIGWNPQSWKICGYMETMTNKALSSLP